MKCICKQCGKSFELTDSESAFYKSKNLSIPKRCKSCREHNKQQSFDGRENAPAKNNISEPTYSTKKQMVTSQKSFHRFVVIAIVVLLAIASTVFGKIVPGLDGSSDATYTNTQSAEENYHFRNADLLEEHFEKHGKEMGFSSAKDYEEAACAVIQNEKALHKIEAEDGDDVYYVESSNDFVIVSTDGYIRTYFKPSDGKSYFERQ